MLKTAQIFQRGMVLQQGKHIPVWGEAAPGADITVCVQGQSVSGRADEQGAWKLWLAPLTASFRETLTIRSGLDTLTLDDVQIGEVWLLGGQSNMEFYMRYDMELSAELEAPDDALRFYETAKISYPEQIHEADYSVYDRWRKACPEELERFSAVGYYFAKRIRKTLGVPVGLVACNWAGTVACAWMPRALVAKAGGQPFLDQYDEAMASYDPAEYDKRFAKSPDGWRMDTFADVFFDRMMFGDSIPRLMERMAAKGIPLPEPQDLTPAIGPKWERRPGGLYETMLKPLAGFGLRGFLYYQGESDGDTFPECYETLFPALIGQWRKLWGEALPFLFTQIAPLDHWMQCVGTPHVIIRAAQQKTADTVPGTGMAVTTDVGMPYDIHPKKKRPVGERLALQAEARVYGKDTPCEAPRLRSMEVSEGLLTLHFDHAEGGLHLEKETPYGKPAPDTCAEWLRVFRNGEELPGETLKPEANGDALYLRSNAIQSNASCRAELAMTGWYQVPLYNSQQLPARPGCIESSEN